MNWEVVCPGCGGPAVVERDVFGHESVRCDAYQRCRPLTPIEALLEQAEREIEDGWRTLLDEVA